MGPRVAKTFSKSLVVPSGERVVNVHLKSAADGFDQEQSCSLNLPPGKAATLVIAMQQNGMSLTFQVLLWRRRKKRGLGLPRLCAVDPAYGRGLGGFSGHWIYGSRISALQKSDLGGARRFPFFVVMSEAKTSRVRMAPRTAGAAATDWLVRMTPHANCLRHGEKFTFRLEKLTNGGRRGAGLGLKGSF